jgi:hypothetical protein
MARRDDCWRFAKAWGLKIISVEDLAEWVREKGEGVVPSKEADGVRNGRSGCGAVELGVVRWGGCGGVVAFETTERKWKDSDDHRLAATPYPVSIANRTPRRGRDEEVAGVEGHDGRISG